MHLAIIIAFVLELPPMNTVKEYSLKIEKAVKEYTEKECLEKTRQILAVLNQRRSLLNLMFLKFICIRIKRETILNTFNEMNGFRVLEKTFTSTNCDYLSTLFDIFVVLKPNRPVSIEALENYDAFDKQLFFKYLNGCQGLHALFDNLSANMTYLQYFISDALTWDEIDDELNFIFKLEHEPQMQQIKINIYKHKEKFKCDITYKRLLEILSKSFRKNMINIDAECIEEYKNTIEKYKSGLEDSNAKYLILESKFKELQLSIENKAFDKTSEIKAVKDVVEIKEPEPKVESAAKTEFKRVEAVKEEVKIAKERIKEQEPKTTIEEKTVVEQKPVEIPLSKEETVVQNIAESTIQKTVELDQQETKPKKPKKFSFGKASKAVSMLDTKQVYCGLRWSKMPKGKRTIFTNINILENEKHFKLEEFKVFEKKVVPKEKKAAEATKGSDLICCMDLKKSNAISIALSVIKLTYEELRDQILKLECENEVLIKQLCHYMCTTEEFEKIKKTDPKKMPNADRFFYIIEDLEEFKEAVASQMFLHLYKAKNYTNIFELTIKTYKRILESQSLKELFGRLLVIGNQLNRNGFGGKAEGFTFDSLSKFHTTQIRNLIKPKIDLVKLKEELGEIAHHEAVDALINEFGEVKSAYVKNTVDEEEYSRGCELFSEMKELQQKVIAFFGLETDDKLMEELLGFVEYFL
ncbi:FORF [Enterospora canceri]|uniref:FORF n=1 Tax=Enterospora canceri TaxID=1081671 RepID=A0A1Y1S891_9MICR|nr:FORF [Enterospora canceri]